MKLTGDLLARYRVVAGPLRSERRLELVLIVFAVLVLLQLLWLGVRAALPASVQPIAPAADSLAVRDSRNAGIVTTQESALVQARPLFWEQRQPLVSPSALTAAGGSEAGGAAGRLQNLRITGVFGSGDAGGAIVDYRGTETRLAVGDEIDGWQLARVAPGVAVLVSNGREDVRRLLPQEVAAVADTVQPQVTTPEPAPALDAAKPEPVSAPATRELSLGGFSPGAGETQQRKSQR